MVRIGNNITNFAVIDRYTGKVCISGSYKKCLDFFNKYVNKLAERDPVIR